MAKNQITLTESMLLAMTMMSQVIRDIIYDKEKILMKSGSLKTEETQIHNHTDWRKIKIKISARKIKDIYSTHYNFICIIRRTESSTTWKPAFIAFNCRHSIDQIKYFKFNNNGSINEIDSIEFKKNPLPSYLPRIV